MLTSLGKGDRLRFYRHLIWCYHQRSMIVNNPWKSNAGLAQCPNLKMPYWGASFFFINAM